MAKSSERTPTTPGPRRHLTRQGIFHAVFTITVMALAVAAALTFAPCSGSADKVLGLCTNLCCLGFGAMLHALAPKS